MVLLLFHWIHSPWRNHCVLHERLASLATPLGTINEGALNPHDYVLAMKKKTKGLAKIIVNAFSRFLLAVAFLYLVLVLSVFLYSWYTHDGPPITGWGWNQVLRN
jgi:hypothetical protein